MCEVLTWKLKDCVLCQVVEYRYSNLMFVMRWWSDTDTFYTQMFHTFFIELLEALLKFYDYGKTNKVSTAMFIKAREARSCSCQSCGEQLVAVVNFQAERDRDIGRPCRGRSPARGACRPVAQLAARRHSLSRFPQPTLSGACCATFLFTRAVMFRTSEQVWREIRKVFRVRSDCLSDVCDNT